MFLNEAGMNKRVVKVDRSLEAEQNSVTVAVRLIIDNNDCFRIILE